VCFRPAAADPVADGQIDGTGAPGPSEQDRPESGQLKAGEWVIAIAPSSVFGLAETRSTAGIVSAKGAAKTWRAAVAFSRSIQTRRGARG